MNDLCSYDLFLDNLIQNINQLNKELHYSGEKINLIEIEDQLKDISKNYLTTKLENNIKYLLFITNNQFITDKSSQIQNPNDNKQIPKEEISDEYICKLINITIILINLINNQNLVLKEFTTFFQKILFLICKEKFDIQNLSIKSCFLNQYQDPVFISNENYSEKIEKTKEEIYNFFFNDLISLFKEKIQINLKSQEEDDFNIYFNNKIDELSKIIETSFEEKNDPIQKLNDLLNRFLMNIKNVFLESKNDKEENAHINIYLNRLINTRKNRYSFDYSIFFQNIRSFFSNYIDKFNYNPIEKFTNDFCVFYILNKFVSFDHDSIFDSAYNLKDYIIQNESQKNYFFFEIFTKMIIDDLLDPRDFPQIIYQESITLFENDCDFPNSITIMCDKYLNFYQRSEDDYFKESYFPLGTINSIVMQKIEISLIDKFIILINMLKNLSNQRTGRYSILCDKSIYIDLKKNVNIHIYNSNNLFDQAPDTNFFYYSFGAIMYELITGNLPESIFKEKNFSNKDIMNCLKNDKYCEYLLKYNNSDVFLDNFVDYNGDSPIGMKAIIENCMKFNPKDQYSSIDEIILSLKKLPIYEKNRFEVEFRTKSNEDNSSKCTFADIFESYCLYQQKSNLKIIERILQIYLKDSKYTIKGDIIKSIHSVFNVKYQINYRISLLLEMSYNQFQLPIPSILKIFDSFTKYVSKDSLYYHIIIYICANFYYSIEHSENLEKNLKLALTEILEYRKFYSFDLIFQSIIQFVVNQKNICKKFSYIFNDDEKYINIYSCYYYGLYPYNGLCLDSSFNFVSKVSISCECKELIDKEKRIYQGKYSKFIIQFINDEYIVPFFSLGQLYDLIRHNFKFTFVDKFIIALECAIGLSDLHSKGEYHGNLSDESVFLTASKDAYIGFFSYNRKNEIASSKTHIQVYYRSPEDNILDEISSKPPIKERQLSDIYSFGVLMHEIFSNIDLCRRFGRMNRANIMILLQSDKYSSFLFSGMNNEIFNDEIGGKIKEIITKCLKYNPKDRFQSMIEVINELKKVQVSEQNSQEIELRLKTAKSSGDLKCTFADLVTSFYRGKKNSKTIINGALGNFTKDSNIIPDNDIIQKILEVFNKK